MDNTLYWSIKPNKIIDQKTGVVVDDAKFVHEHSLSEWIVRLTEVVDDCINYLQQDAFSKFGRAKRKEINVYAGKELSKLVTSLSGDFKQSNDVQKTDIASKPLGLLGDYNFHSDKILSNEIRIVANFDVSDTKKESYITLFGRINVLDM